MQRGALKGVQLGVGIRKGFLEEEVCKLDQDGWGEGRRGQKNRRVWAPNPRNKKAHFQGGNSQAHLGREDTLPLFGSTGFWEHGG